MLLKVIIPGGSESWPLQTRKNVEQLIPQLKEVLLTRDVALHVLSMNGIWTLCSIDMNYPELKLLQRARGILYDRSLSKGSSGTLYLALELTWDSRLSGIILMYGPFHTQTSWRRLPLKKVSSVYLDWLLFIARYVIFLLEIRGCLASCPAFSWDEC